MENKTKKWQERDVAFFIDEKNEYANGIIAKIFDHTTDNVDHVEIERRDRGMIIKRLDEIYKTPEDMTAQNRRDVETINFMGGYLSIECECQPYFENGSWQIKAVGNIHCSGPNERKTGVEMLVDMGFQKRNNEFTKTIRFDTHKSPRMANPPATRSKEIEELAATFDVPVVDIKMTQKIEENNLSNDIKDTEADVEKFKVLNVIY